MRAVFRETPESFVLRKPIWSALFFILMWTAPLYAESPDFYGIKMTSESFVKDMVFDSASGEPAFVNEGKGLDKNIYAYGYLKDLVMSGRGVEFRVFNNSDMPIAAAPHFRDYIVVSKDGRRYDMSEASMEWYIDTIDPGKSATFGASLAGLPIKNENIRMVICSFDLGKTKIILLPLPRKFQEDKIENKPPLPFAAAPVKTKRMESPEVFAEKKTEQKENKWFPFNLFQGSPAPSKEAPKPAVKRQVNFNHYESSGSEKSSVSTTFFKKKSETEKFKRNPVIKNENEGAASFQNKILPSSPPRSSAEVREVHAKDGFIIINAGIKDGLKENIIIDVLHNGRSIARAVVKKLREDVSAATLLPEWTKEEVRQGDKISIE